MRYLTYSQIADGQSYEHGTAVVKGSSLTIPGQGSDLAQIIASIVKLPELDERSFDSPSNMEPDVTRLGIKTELDSLYPAEARAAGEAAELRQQERKRSKGNKENEEEKEPATTTPKTDDLPE